jgi:hypothetical protein
VDMDRHLDDVYFNVMRNGELVNVCFSDLDSQEAEKILNTKGEVYLRSLCLYLGDRLKQIGNELNITKNN